jgi:hypothetical protein
VRSIPEDVLITILAERIFEHLGRETGIRDVGLHDHGLQDLLITWLEQAVEYGPCDLTCIAFWPQRRQMRNSRLTRMPTEAQTTGRAS